MRRLMGVFVVTALVGCAVPTQQAASTDPSVTCFQRLRQDERFDSISDKIGLTLPAGSAPTVDMLNDKSLPTEAQQRALRVYVVAMQSCSDWGDKWRAERLPPEAKALDDGALGSFVADTAKLIDRQLTFGQYSEMRQAARSAYARDMAAIRGTYVARERQEAILKDNAANTRLLLLQQSAPRVVRCTSTSLWGTVQTTCR